MGYWGYRKVTNGFRWTSTSHLSQPLIVHNNQITPTRKEAPFWHSLVNQRSLSCNSEVKKFNVTLCVEQHRFPNSTERQTGWSQAILVIDFYSFYLVNVIVLYLDFSYTTLLYSFSCYFLFNLLRDFWERKSNNKYRLRPWWKRQMGFHPHGWDVT